MKKRSINPLIGCYTERKNNERAWPIGWGKINLEDYLD